MKNTEGEQSNSKENKTNGYQNVTVGAAVGAAVAAALATGVNAYQACLIRQNNIVSQSAFVSAKSIYLFPRQTTPSGPRSWEIQIVWGNNGNTFASDVAASRAGYPAETGSPSTPPPKLDEVPTFFLAPHAETSAGFITIAPEVVRAILDKKKIFNLFWRVKYKDIFGRAHVTQQGWQLTRITGDKTLDSWPADQAVSADFSRIEKYTCVDEQCEDKSQ